MKKIFFVVVVLLLAAAMLISCSRSSAPNSVPNNADNGAPSAPPVDSTRGEEGASDTTYVPGPIPGDFVMPGGLDSDIYGGLIPPGGTGTYILGGDGTEPIGGNIPVVSAGQITAAENNDNEGYQDWLSLLAGGQEDAEGIYENYLSTWDFDTRNRIVVNITKDDLPVCGAAVRIFKGETLLFSAISDAKGKAYLFPKSVEENDSLMLEIGGATVQQQLTYTPGMPEVLIEVSAASEKLNRLEIMFVVDTTGSMSDELEYLKSEIQDVVTQVKTAHPQADIAVALLFYRDTGDEYVTRYFDFTSDIDVVKNNISAQSAGGGGDFPEAVHTALHEAVSKQWSTGNATKLLIHVLDAPPHDTVQIMSTYETSIIDAAEKGIRMIPVASSGIDRGTEYLLRNEAMQTGGTYVFITNNSGIGNDHLEPTVEEYVVEYLNALLVRVIEEYYTGTDIAPVPYGQ